MAEQMTPPSYELAAAQSMCCKGERCRTRPGSCPAEVCAHWSRHSARAALTAIGMTEAQQMMPVGSLAIVPEDVAKRRAEHAARVADAYDRIHRAGRPAARPGSEG